MNGLRRAHCPGWRRGTIFRILVKSSRSYAQNRIFLDRLGLSRIVGEKIPAYFYLSGSVPTKDGYRPRHRHRNKKASTPGIGTETKKASIPGTGIETKKASTPGSRRIHHFEKISKKKPRHHSMPRLQSFYNGMTRQPTTANSIAKTAVIAFPRV